MIKRAICDRACLSGSHGTFRVRFAPHALGRDENARHIVFAFEHGGLTWASLTVVPSGPSAWPPTERRSMVHWLSREQAAVRPERD
jgi:hypothetical protein